MILWSIWIIVHILIVHNSYYYDSILRFLILSIFRPPLPGTPGTDGLPGPTRDVGSIDPAGPTGPFGPTVTSGVGLPGKFYSICLSSSKTSPRCNIGVILPIHAYMYYMSNAFLII